MVTKKIIFYINKMTITEIVDEAIRKIKMSSLDTFFKNTAALLLRSLETNHDFINFANCRYGLLCNKKENRRKVITLLIAKMLENPLDASYIKGQLRSNNYSANTMEEFAREKAEQILDFVSTGGKSTFNFKGKQSEENKSAEKTIALKSEYREFLKRAFGNSCETVTNRATDISKTLQFEGNKRKAESVIDGFRANCKTAMNGILEAGTYSEDKRKTRPSPSHKAKEKSNQEMRGNDGNMYISKADKNGVFRWYKLKGPKK